MALIGFLLLVGGQFLVEQVFQWQTTIGTVIQLLGGVFFISKLLLERKNHDRNKNVSKNYAKTQVLTECSLALPEQKMIAFIGPNGAGKAPYSPWSVGCWTRELVIFI